MNNFVTGSSVPSSDLFYNPCRQDWLIHTIKTTNAQILRLYFLNTICPNSDMFRPILIIFRDLLNISKAYIKT